MEALKDCIAQTMHPDDVEKQKAYRDKLWSRHHWQFDSLTNKNVERMDKPYTSSDLMFSHIMHEGSMRMKRFQHLHEGDIAQRINGRWVAMANIHAPYTITRERRSGRVQYSDRYFFKITPSAL